MADTVRVYVKGAPEYILPNCNTHYNAAGQKVPFLEQTRETLTNSIISEKMTRQGLRTIAFSYRDFTVEAFEEIKELTKDFTAPDSSEMLESDNTLLALVAMQDPLRDRVKNVVLFAEKGKVNVRMVTNNSLDTAKAVAVEAGILPKEIFSWPMDKQVQYAMHAADFKQAVGGIRQTQDEDGNMKFVP
jgi:magnesium-transporting ATPase (P-type)